ncbi:MAG: sensor histidine kinase [Pseudomonadota bacterium]
MAVTQEGAERAAGRAPPPRGSAPARRGSVRGRLALLLGVAIAPALLIAVAFALRSYDQQTDRAERSFLRDAAAHARAVRDLLVSAGATLETLADSPALADLEAPACDAALAAVAAREPAFTFAIAVTPDGRVPCASRPLGPGPAFGLTPELPELLADDSPRLTFVTLDETGGAAAAITLPLRGPGGRSRGLMVLVAPLEALRAASPRLARSLGVEETIRTAILDGAGRVMLDNPSAPRGWLPPAEAIAPLPEQGASLLSAQAAGGEDWVYAVTPLWRGRAWLLSGLPAGTLYAPALPRAAAPIIAPFIMLLVAVGVAYFAIDRLVVRHVVYLTRLTRAYGRGRLALRPRGLEDAPRELAQLAEDLSDMASHLEDRQSALRAAAETNRFLLREVHHRVKNNLQMIVSLLNLQIRRAPTEPEREALERIRSRVMAVAAVHSAIYAAETLDRVSLATLVARVTRPQTEMTTLSEEPPELRLDLDEVEDAPERATPLALLANEAMTNAVKYGARAEGRQLIEVTLRARPGGGYRFSVSNDVLGEVPAPARNTVGARLIDGFARQIGGELRRETREGRFIVTLDVPPPPAPAAGDED